MTKHLLHLAKNGQRYVFRYRAGREEEIVAEIVRLAEDGRTELDWLDAATLGYQVARHAAMDCCTVMISPGPVERTARGITDHSAGPDDAKDGPCTNTNCP